MKIRDLKISARARGCLINAGYSTVEEIVNLPDNGLSGIHNLNGKCAKEIKDVITEYNRDIEPETDFTLDLHKVVKIREILRHNQEKLVARDDWDIMDEYEDYEGLSVKRHSVQETQIKIYRNIMHSLGGGTVPRGGLGYITVVRAQEIDSLLRDNESIQNGGATFKFVVGDHGSGKTFLLQMIKENYIKNGFIVTEVDLSSDRNLIGDATNKKGLATYRELMSNVSNKVNQTGAALAKVIESWVKTLFVRAAKELTKNPRGETNLERIAETLMLHDCTKLQSLAYGLNFRRLLNFFGKQVEHLI